VVDLPASKTKIDEAGDLLRLWALEDRDGASLETPTLSGALELLVGYRSVHTLPLLRVQVTVGERLYEVVPAAGPPTGRSKRGVAIVTKLMRFPTMRLTQMEDIAGCRVKLPDQSGVDAVLGALRDAWPEAHLIDYVATPKRGGYRAKHLIVVEQGCHVEVQVRTERQNVWADEVEKAADAMGHPLKDAEGPSDLVRYFEVAAAVLAAADEGRKPDESLTEALSDLRRQVRPYFQRGAS
jgi:hypothetical protein